MGEYRVNLDIYDGPLDLLLYLIRREEVDIHDIPIARITEQYLSYVEVLNTVDPNLAGEFLVMAATLMEIKTRTLLPTPTTKEGAEDGEAMDPRAELVRQLLEYKAFKDAAGDLTHQGELQAMRFARTAKPPELDTDELDIEDVQVWDLLDSFNHLMESIGRQPREHEVIYDDTPIELHATDLLDRLHREGPMPFTRIFEGRRGRSEIIGLFLALLELIRRRILLASQKKNFAEILIDLNPNPPEEDEADAGTDEVTSIPRVAPPQDDAQAEGQYVSESPRGEDEDDGPGTEAAGAGA